MSERTGKESDEPRSARTRREGERAAAAQPSSEHGAVTAAPLRALLRGAGLPGALNSPVRAQALRSAQQVYGNRATRQAVSRASGSPAAMAQRARSTQVPVQRSEDEGWWKRIGDAVSGGAERAAEMVGPLPPAPMGQAAAAGMSMQGVSMYPGVSPLTIGLPHGKVASVDEDPASQAIIGAAKKAGRGLASAGKWGKEKMEDPLGTLKGAGETVWDWLF